jgi:hypothetical protein
LPVGEIVSDDVISIVVPYQREELIEFTRIVGNGDNSGNHNRKSHRESEYIEVMDLKDGSLREKHVDLRFGRGRIIEAIAVN